MKKTVIKRKPTKKQVKKPVGNEQLLQTILKTTLEGFWLTDLQGSFLQVNDAYCRMIDYSQKELLAMTVLDVEAVESRKATAAHIKKVIAKGEDRFESRHKRKDGSILDVEISAQYQPVDGGRFVVFVRDITEKKQADATQKRLISELRDTDTRLDMAQTASRSGIWDWNIKTGNIKWSSQLFDLFGLDSKTSTASFASWNKVLHPEDVEVAGLRVENAVKDHATLHSDYRIVLPDGQVRWITSAGEAQYDSQSKPVKMVGICIDITEHKKAEAKLLSITTAVEAASDAIGISDAQGRHFYHNKALSDLFGYATAEELQAAGGGSAVVKDPDVAREMFASITSGKSWAGELKMVTKSGRVFPAYERADAIKDSKGNVVGLVGVIRDITIPKKTEALVGVHVDLLAYSLSHSIEEILQHALDRLCEIIDSPIGFYHFVEEDQKTLTLKAWSTRTEKEFCKAEAKGMQYSIDKAGVWVDCVRAQKTVIHNDYKSLPNRKGLPEGHAAVIREMVVPIIRSKQIVAILGVGNKPSDYSEDDKKLVSYLADVTWTIIERKRAEKRLLKSEVKFRESMEALLEGCQIIGFDWRFIYLNTAAAKQGRKPVDEFLGHTMMEVLPGIENTEMFKMLKLCMEERKPQHMVNEFGYWDGGKGWFELSIHPIDEGIFILSIDITERKRAEAELKTKSAEIERFLYTASHDLKTPVVTIQSFMRHLEKDLIAADAGRIQMDLNFINTAADKMANLLNDLLAMARVGRLIGASSHVTVKELVNDVVATVAGRIADRGITVKVDDIDVGLYGDRLRLAEIWQNLIENACKFMGDQLVPCIEIGIRREEQKSVEGRTLNVEGEDGTGRPPVRETVAAPDQAIPVFFVRDNGIGIDPKHHDRVFDMFERLDKKIEGTGMGLAIVKRIVELYQGRIWVESAGAKQGTTFCFILPGAIKTEGKT